VKNWTLLILQSVLPRWFIRESLEHGFLSKEKCSILHGQPIKIVDE